MSTMAAAKQGAPMARKRKEQGICEDETRFNFRAPESWFARLERCAARWGLTASAYIRLRMTEAMDREEMQAREMERDQ